ncbi:MAG: hypothetical protein FWF60_02385, partial [Oscillospiraceae bacterium]|nr:hypothetical protein [Oscillospiraceae bacterium]
RSRRVWEKHGFTRVLEELLEPQPQKGKWQYHYRLTRQEYLERKAAEGEHPWTTPTGQPPATTSN